MKLPDWKRVARTAPSLFWWGARAWNVLAGPLRLRHPCAVVEISPSCVKAARTNVSPGGGRSLLWTRRDMEPGVLDVRLAEMEIPRPADLARHVARALESVGAAEEEVSVFFPSLAARAVTLEFDAFPTSLSEQMDMVRWKIAPKLPYPSQEARIAHEPLPAPPLGGDGKTRVFAVAMRSDAAEAVEEAFGAAGVRVGFMQPSFIHLLTVAALPEPTLIVSASPGRVSFGVARGNDIMLIREKDASHMNADEYRDMRLREALATAKHCEDRMAMPATACRFVADDPSCPFDMERLSEALGMSVEPCPWPAELEPDPAFTSPEAENAFAALAWAVSPQ